MSGEAQQFSFMQGEVSPEFYFRSDLASFNSSVSRGSNVKLGPLGGLSNRRGTKVDKSAASLAGKITNLQTSNDYVSCVFQHYVNKAFFELEVFNDNGSVKICCNGEELNLEVYDGSGVPGPFDIRGDLLDGIKGLHFVIHNDLLIFSKTLPVRVLIEDISAGELKYVIPIDDTYAYTETQFCIRMLSESPIIRLESNLTLQNSATLTSPISANLSTTYSGTITGNASYALIGETDDGNDVSLKILNSLPGTSLTITKPAGTVADVIPYPIGGNVTNYLDFASIDSSLTSFGGKTITKLKLYRTTGKHAAYNSLYKLVAKFGVDGATSISINDRGQEEPAYTVCADTSALYRQPSFHSICSSAEVNKLVGGIKTVVSTAVFQQRAYYAMNKGKWWGTSVYNNTIVVSRVNALGQVIYPQISNPSEAFQFNVPEERGGFLTHLASMSRLVAFTNTSTFVIQGDEAGIITPTSINPFKVLSFGCMKNVPPVVSGDTCLFASTGGGVGYLTIDSEGGAVGGNASALAGHMFENKTILSIVPVEDRKSLPRFLINTTDGDLYECYKVGDRFAFFRQEMLGLPSKVLSSGSIPFPLTRVHSPAYAKTTYGAEAYVNYRMVDADTGNHYVNNVDILAEPLVTSKFFDFTSQLDFVTEIGSNLRYLSDPQPAVDRIYEGWLYESKYSVVEPVDPPTGHSLITHLADPLGTWAAHNQIEITSGKLPLEIDGSEPQLVQGNKYMRFIWLDSNDELKIVFAKLNYDSPLSGWGYYTLEFSEDVPTDLRTRSVYLNPPVDSDLDALMGKGYVIVELAFDKVIVSDDSYGRIWYRNIKGYCDMMLEGDISGQGTVEDPIEIPITLKINGNIYGNFKDPLNTTEFKIKHYYGDPDGLWGEHNYFEIELPEPCSWFAMGSPAIGEIETLPVASVQTDITDAKKNIDYVSVLLYNTKGLRVGEAGQADSELEKMDFTTEESVTEPVYFSGPKSYNFGSTWNDHGRIRVSGLDLQPFSISGIIPKGNVGGF